MYKLFYRHYCEFIDSEIWVTYTIRKTDALNTEQSTTRNNRAKQKQHK